jgi:hypothetical protein
MDLVLQDEKRKITLSPFIKDTSHPKAFSQWSIFIRLFEEKKEIY